MKTMIERFKQVFHCVDVTDALEHDRAKAISEDIVKELELFEPHITSSLTGKAGGREQWDTLSVEDQWDIFELVVLELFEHYAEECLGEHGSITIYYKTPIWGNKE